MIDTIEHFNLYQDKVKQKLIPWVRDRSINLDIRWTAFMNSNLGKSMGYIQYLDNDPVIAEYIDGLENRHTTILMESVYEWAIDLLEEDNPIFLPEDLNNFREKVLNSFIKDFCYDW